MRTLDEINKEIKEVERALTRDQRKADHYNAQVKGLTRGLAELMIERKAMYKVLAG